MHDQLTLKLTSSHSLNVPVSVLGQIKNRMGACVNSTVLHTLTSTNNLFQLKLQPRRLRKEAVLHRITSTFEKVQNGWLWFGGKRASSGTTSVGWQLVKGKGGGGGRLAPNKSRNFYGKLHYSRGIGGEGGAGRRAKPLILVVAWVYCS